MALSSLRPIAVMLFSLAAAGCAGTPEWGTTAGNLPAPYIAGTRVVTPDKPLQCVAYARSRSGVAIYGDAVTWWDKADGRYARGSTPQLDAVIVLTGYGGSDRAHLGVVTMLLSEREIRIDHANWLNDGAIYIDDPVADVSPDNDWSQVRVWNPRTQNWGARTYPVQGFIGPAVSRRQERISSN